MTAVRTRKAWTVVAMMLGVWGSIAMVLCIFAYEEWSRAAYHALMYTWLAMAGAGGTIAVVIFATHKDTDI